jgi:hypothetical protein
MSVSQAGLAPPFSLDPVSPIINGLLCATDIISWYEL